MFGLYRPPSPRVPPRRHLIVICNAVLHEYFKVQHVARQLSKLLADSGYDVLRFDFSGQGNSGGDLNRLLWHEDLRLAVREGQSISGAMKTSLVGFRAGALIAASSGVSAHSIVMWDPVSSGAEYLKQLQDVHQRLVKSHYNLSAAAAASVAPGEILGSRTGNDFTDKMRQIRIDWDDLAANRCSVVLSSPQPDLQGLAGNNGIEVVDVPFVCQWDQPSSRLLFAHDVIQQLAGMLR